MSLAELVIERKQEGKGRAFAATYLASASADALWEGGKTDVKDIVRPVYAAIMGSDSELKSFVANLVGGRRALLGSQNYSRRRGKGFEFLKSAGYRYTWQREAEGSIVQVFLPELFLMDPGMVDPQVAKFVILPPAAWAARQEIEVGEIVRHAAAFPLIQKMNTAPVDRWGVPIKGFEPPFSDERLAAMVPVAYLFAAHLDRRTRAPILADGRFYLQLMLACLQAGLASWSVTDHYSNSGKFGENKALGFVEDATDVAGFLPGVAFQAQHEVLEALLAEEIDSFFQMTKTKTKGKRS